MFLFLGEDERVADFQHGEGERQQSAGHEIGGDEGGGDPPEGAGGRAAEIHGGFFECHAGLLESGDRAAHDIRQSSHAVGDDEDDDRIVIGHQEVKWSAFAGHGEVAESHDQPGNGQGQHGQRIQPLASWHIAAADEPGDADPQHEINKGRERGVFQAVSDRSHRPRVTQSICVVLQRERRWNDGLVPVLGKADQQHADMGQQGDRGDAGK